MLGKSAAFVHECVQRERPIDFGDPTWRRALNSASDAFVNDYRTDEGSNNMGTMKHDAHVFLNDYSKALLDTSSCMLHVLKAPLTL